MIVHLDFELIFILGPKKFTSLQKMTDNPGSSRLQYPIYLADKLISVIDMFQNKKAGCYIKRFVIPGKFGFQITNDFFDFFAGMFMKQILSDITGYISFLVSKHSDIYTVSHLQRQDQ